RLKPYIRHMAISENDGEKIYKVFPSSGLVIGFQYKGKLAVLNGGAEDQLSRSGITGIADSFKVFKTSTGIGTVLVYFTEIGFSHFTSCPAHDLFNLSISLENLFPKQNVIAVEERLSAALTDAERIKVVEAFLISQLKEKESDKLIVHAVNLIYGSKGSIRIKELLTQIHISQSAFEKRFRRLVGTSPKKFSSIVRFNTVLHVLNQEKSLTEICYDNNFFDQAHFIKDFRQYTGDSPETFRRFL
ncbi:MAG TPA: helix-turn-helix domain-containing protein, partial [Puia sp.]|nr:helix-turn-helix domain-containing protein [Puia sp.]